MRLQSLSVCQRRFYKESVAQELLREIVFPNKSKMGNKIFWPIKITRLFSALSQKAERTVRGGWSGLPYYSVTYLEPGEQQDSLNSKSSHFKL